MADANAILIRPTNWVPAGDWDRADELVRLRFLTHCAGQARALKLAELEAGKGVDGRLLKRVKPSSRPDGALGPPLSPHDRQSRTQKWLRASIGQKAGTVTLWWSHGWGVILGYHREGNAHLPVRDVIGLTVASWRALEAEARRFWSVVRHGLASLRSSEPITYPGLERRLSAAPPTAPPPRIPVAGSLSLEGTFHTGDRALVERAIASGHFTGFRRLPGPYQPFTPGGGGGPKPPAPVVPVIPPAQPRIPLPAAAVPGRMSPAVRERARTLVGREVTQAELAAAIGAPPGTQLRARAAGRGELKLELDAAGVRAFRTLYRDPRGDLVVFNDSIQVAPERQGQGLGSQIFGRQIAGARQLGVKALRTSAERSPDSVGYSVWPKFGYDAPLPAAVRARLPAELLEAQRLSDLMQSEAGQRWWTEHGQTIGVTFDLDPGSLSMQIWDAYLRRRAQSP